MFLGCAAAVAAGALVAREPESGGPSAGGVARGAVEAVLAGALLGSSLVLFGETSEGSGQWPVVAARVSALVLVGVAAVALASRGRGGVTFPRGQARWFAVGAGVLDVAATALLVVALRRELVVVVAPFAALAPAFTVLLSCVFTGERLLRVQRLGLALALAGLVLVALG